MIQRLAHWLSGIGLHWFYADIRIVDSERIPLDGPLLVAMNHQNALVDAMLALEILPRMLRITAKATLGSNIAGAALVRAAGIIPLSRASDSPLTSDPVRNRHSFEMIIDELRLGGAVLLFPEGRSHNDAELAPLKTGLARIALRARDSGVRGIRILPIGVTYEDKATPETMVVARIGEPMALDDWQGDDAHQLTDNVAQALRSLSFVPIVGESGSVNTEHGALIRLAAWWGRITHEIPLRIARHQAKRCSDGIDESAMYTMTFGLAAILLSYTIEALVAWLLFGWIASALLLGSLVLGAYYAAYTGRFPKDQPVSRPDS